MGSENGLGDLTGPSAWRELVPFDKLRSTNTLASSADTLAAGINTQIVAFQQMMVLTVCLASMVVVAITDRIQRVLAACAPSEVFQAVVRFVIVEVSTHQPLRTGSDEGSQHEMMNTTAASSGEDNRQTSATTICRPENTTRRTHLAFGTDFVAFNSSDRLPHACILEDNHAK